MWNKIKEKFIASVIVNSFEIVIMVLACVLSLFIGLYAGALSMLIFHQDIVQLFLNVFGS